MFTSLYNLRWHRLRVTLVNTRNTFAREHPLSIFQAVFKAAAQRRAPPPEESWFFHPRQTTLAARLHKGRPYPLELIFPRTEPELIREFGTQLAEHLADPSRNFRLEEISSPELRTLAALEAETPELEEPRTELCLEFHTPLRFEVPDRQHRWMLSKPMLALCLAGRVRKLFGLELPLEAPFEPVEVLPYYWQYEEHRHVSKSNPGRQYINGCAGPLYLKGALAPLLPLLRLCSELHAGERLSYGQGYFALRATRPCFDVALKNPSTWRSAFMDMAAQSDEPNEFLHPLTSPDDSIATLVSAIRNGSYAAEPAEGMRLAKPGAHTQRRQPPPGAPAGQVEDQRNAGSSPSSPPGRVIAVLGPKEKLVHHVLHRLLAPVLDRMFEDCSVGYRPGRSLATARKAIAQAYREGCTWVLESDIASFFDEIDWELLRRQISRCLPEADACTLRLLDQCVRAPLRLDGQAFPRERGLLQGSPLSPLLSNLFLDPFDEAAHRAGLRLVRYADDFLVLARTKEEAQRALETIKRLLEPLKLVIHAEKTGVTPVEAGFSFLGMDLGPLMDEEFVEQTALRKPVFVREQYAFLGIDGASLTLRKDDQLIAELPLNRIGELVVLGNNSLSARLIQRCCSMGIPISFCTAAGYYSGTLRPDSRNHFELAGRHLARREGLLPEEALNCAARIVAAKLGNYRAWVRESPGSERAGLVAELDGLLARLDNATSLEELRGLEGIAARSLFRWVNDRIKFEEWRATHRERRAKADPYNSLLDFAYSLLFTRLNVLLRARGLNPYLGFLHSPSDNFESLVCDLQEPFRSRYDRFLIKVINRRVVQASDFEKLPDGRLRLNSEAVGRFLEAHQQEQTLRLASDPGSLQQLLHAQVCSIEGWVREGTRPLFYRADLAPPANPKPADEPARADPPPIGPSPSVPKAAQAGVEAAELLA